MPQMAPIWWSTLFLIFILSYMVIITTMYFFQTYFLKSETKKNKFISNINWKW